MGYGHDKQKALEASEGKPTRLIFPSGKDHVLLPNGQHINQNKFRGTKKQRLAARRQAKTFKPIPLLPMGTTFISDDKSTPDGCSANASGALGTKPEV